MFGTDKSAACHVTVIGVLIKERQITRIFITAAGRGRVGTDKASGTARHATRRLVKQPQVNLFSTSTVGTAKIARQRALNRITGIARVVTFARTTHTRAGVENGGL